jgi:hypothetical protein
VGALVLQGCIVAAVAVGGAAVYGAVKYTENGAQEDFHAGVRETFDAAVQALTDRGHDVPATPQPSENEGHIQAGDVDVDIQRYHAKTGDFTRVVVKVGTFETEEHQRQAGLILGRIGEILGEDADG